MQQKYNLASLEAVLWQFAWLMSFNIKQKRPYLVDAFLLQFHVLCSLFLLRMLFVTRSEHQKTY